MQNILKQVMFATALFMTTTLAFAAYSPKDVANAINQGNYSQAETMIKEVTSSQPDSAQAWFYRAQIEAELARQGKMNPQTALDSLDKARNAKKSMAGGEAKYTQLETRIKGLMGNGLETKAQSAIRNNNWDSAQSILKQWTSQEPDSAKAWYFLAQVEERLGNYSEAKKSLTRATALSPSFSFTNNQASVSNMQVRLDERLKAQNSYKTTNSQTTQSTAVNTPSKSYTNEAPSSHSANVSSSGNESSGGFTKFLLIILFVGIFLAMACVGFSKHQAAKQRKMRLKEEDNKRQAYMLNIDKAMTKLESMRKELAYTSQDDTPIYKAVDELKNNFSLIGIHFKTGSETWKSHEDNLSQYFSEYQDLVQQYESGNTYDPDRLDKQKEADRQEALRIQEQERKERKQREQRQEQERVKREEQARIDRQVYAEQQANQRSQQHQQPQQHNHYHNDNGLGNLATGVILGSILNGNSHSGNHTTTIIEREREVERPAPSNNDFDFGSNKSSSNDDFDFGNNSGGFDFGGDSDKFDPGPDNNNEW